MLGKDAPHHAARGYRHKSRSLNKTMGGVQLAQTSGLGFTLKKFEAESHFVVRLIRANGLSQELNSCAGIIVFQNLDASFSLFGEGLGADLA